MANKLGRMMTSVDRLLAMMSYGPFITWPCGTRGSLAGGDSSHDRLNYHQLPVNLKQRRQILSAGLFFMWLLINWLYIYRRKNNS